MSVRSRFLFCAALVALLCVSSGQVTKSGPGYLLRMKWAKGDAYAYTITNSTKMPNGQTMSIPMGLTVKVDKVTNGVAEVTNTVTIQGQKPTTVQSKMDSRGEVGNSSGMAGFSAPKLPEKAVTVGATWTSTATVGQGTKPMKTTSTYTFRGIENVGKVQCAVVDVKTTAAGAAPVTATGKLYLQVSNGQLYKAQITSSVTMTAGGKTQTIKSEMAIARK